MNQIDLSKDSTQWRDELDEDGQLFISRLLSFLTALDQIIHEVFLTPFSTQIKVPEARFFLESQVLATNVHQEMHTLLIDTYVKDKAERDFLLGCDKSVPCCINLFNWAKRWANASFGERLVASIVVEDVFFAGGFAAISWLKHQEALPGLTTAHDLIRRDKELRKEFTSALFKHLKHRPSPEIISKMVTEAVDLNVALFKKFLVSSPIGINSAYMSRYIEFVADHLLVDFGCKCYYHSDNPFYFMQS